MSFLTHPISMCTPSSFLYLHAFLPSFFACSLSSQSVFVSVILPAFLLVLQLDLHMNIQDTSRDGFWQSNRTVLIVSRVHSHFNVDKHSPIKIRSPKNCISMGSVKRGLEVEVALIDNTVKMIKMWLQLLISLTSLQFKQIGSEKPLEDLAYLSDLRIYFYV